MMLLDRVRQTIREHDLIRSSTRVVAAVSGGSDSVALAHLLHELDAAGEAHLVGVVHVNHQLRELADRDEQFAAAVAAALGTPLVAEREDVGARARRERRSVEDAARAARHAAFERARRRLNADVVALGHTRDDQAETFLLRLVRGAGPRGLAGMYPRNGSIVRPLVACRRHELREWLAERRLEFVEDETNADVAIPRNRVRAEILPLLASRFNPAIVDVLADEADVARDAWQAIEMAADEIASPIVKAGEHGCVIDIDGLKAAPPPLRRVVVWRALVATAGSRPIGFAHVASVMRLLEPGGASSVDVPGQRVERIGGRLVLRERPRAAEAARHVTGAAKATNLFEYPLSIPGEVEVAEAGCVVSAQALDAVDPVQAADRRAMTGNGPVAMVSGELCRARLAVRNRRPGDRFRPVGLVGRKKLQDVFVDRKVARAERDAVPIVVDEAGRIVWVAGHGIDEAFRVTDAAQAVLLLRLRPVGGSA